MDAHLFTASSEDEGVRLDVFLAARLGTTRSIAQKAVLSGAVTINNGYKPAKARYLIKNADCVQAFVPSAEPAKTLPQDIPLDILYEDDEIIVVNKPGGMVVHPGAGNPDGTLVNALLHHAGALAFMDTPRPGIVHRIDKDTSGAVVAAKTDAAYYALAVQFSAHTITRRYIALVRGVIKEEGGTVDKPLGRCPKDRKKFAVAAKNGKRAVTHYSVISRGKKCTLIRAVLETGRTHQIRVHMAHIGHPLIGDKTYGNPKSDGIAFERHALHALTLGFNHPATGDYMQFHARFPQDFLLLMNRFRSG